MYYFHYKKDLKEYFTKFGFYKKNLKIKEKNKKDEILERYKNSQLILSILGNLPLDIMVILVI